MIRQGDVFMLRMSAAVPAPATDQQPTPFESREFIRQSSYNIDL